jgi:stage IV sporulation protein FB
MLSRSEIIGALQSAEPGAPVAAFARRETPTIGDAATVGDALPHLNGGESVGVVDAEGRLVGLLTRQSLAEIMMIRDMRPDWRFSRRTDGQSSVA